jgi:hypothetical protein
MKSKTILTVFIFLIVTAAFTFSEENTSSTEKENFYENTMLRINNGFWEGIYITRGTVKYSIAISDDLEKILETDKKAIASFLTFKTDRTISMVFLITGLGCFAGDFGYLAYSMNDRSNFNPVIPTGLAVGAIVASVIGTVFDQLGYTSLFDSIWEYNKSLLAGR